MQAKYGDMIVDVWQISDEFAPAPWVLAALQRGTVAWQGQTDDENLMSLNDNGHVTFAVCGDYLVTDGQHYRLVPLAAFDAEYTIID